MGGSSSINGMVYVRGQPLDYDTWSQLGNRGWSYESVLPYFSKSENFIMISLMAKLNCNSFWEKMLIPSFIFFFQKLYPFNYVNDKKKNLAAAAGGFIFCKASEFKKENLYNKISNKVIDDCNIAKLLKKNGAIWLGLTNQIKSGRNYKNLNSIWNMVSRTAFEQLNHSLILLLSLIHI